MGLKTLFKRLVDNRYWQQRREIHTLDMLLHSQQQFMTYICKIIHTNGWDSEIIERLQGLVKFEKEHEDCQTLTGEAAKKFLEQDKKPLSEHQIAHLKKCREIYERSQEGKAGADFAPFEWKAMQYDRINAAATLKGSQDITTDDVVEILVDWWKDNVHVINKCAECQFRDDDRHEPCNPCIKDKKKDAEIFKLTAERDGYKEKADRLLAIFPVAKHEDWCPYITTCNGTLPEVDEHPDTENCPCDEYGAPCWYYTNVYLPLKEWASHERVKGN